jgi:hypothetical protein
LAVHVTARPTVMMAATQCAVIALTRELLSRRNRNATASLFGAVESNARLVMRQWLWKPVSKSRTIMDIYRLPPVYRPRDCIGP